MKKLLVIDAHALIHRAYHALPPLTSSTGKPVNAVYGFLLIVMSALRDMKPDYVAVSFDGPEDTFRHEAYPEYKATRSATADDLIEQFPLVHDIVEAFGFANFTVPRYEADDIIATIAAKMEKHNEKATHAEKIRTIILSGDMDLLQLVTEDTHMVRLRKGVKDMETFTPQHVRDVYGFGPEHVIEYKGLRGDTSDNIPGVKGIGEKSATDLIAKYGNIEGIYEHLDELKGRVLTALEGHKKDAIFSRKLATVDRKVKIDFKLKDAAVGQYDEARIRELFQEFEFKSLLVQLPTLPGWVVKEGLFAEPVAAPKKSAGKKASGKNATQDSLAGLGGQDVEETTGPLKKADEVYTLVNTPEEWKKLLKEVKAADIIAFDTETTGLDPMKDNLVGVSISAKENTGWYIPCIDPKTKEVVVADELRDILEDKKIKKTGHNIKFDIEVMHHAGVQVNGVVFDTMLASWILSAGARGNGLDNLVFLELGYSMQPITDLIGKGKNQITMADVDPERVSWYAAEDADFSLRLYNLFAPRMEKQPKIIRDLFTEIEMPTMLALVDVEEAGVKIDVEFLLAMSKKLHKRIAILDREIQEKAGVQFNVNSPVQLKDILFETLGLPTDKIKKTKTGYSTAAPELEKLRGTHPIIEMIGEYRELSKLTSTYIDALPRLVNPYTGRIHTNYNQTIAATGRLSSQDPNLQNIPIRTELGNEIRKAFIAAPGRKIVALDYSQIELRVVAHLAKDKVMTAAFQNHEDIHKATAAELNDVDIKDVTSDMRRASKAINFGILYGMGVQGIMRDSGIGRDEARVFLDKYFSVHTGIHAYIEKIKEETKKNGYAETLFGRRRALPEINASNRMLAAAAERAAVNMPVQGTAADIMKLAMIAVNDAIKDGKINATMMLQVHDELVFEIDEKLVKSESKKIQEIMENVYTLDVPLVVDVEYGDSWGDLEDVK